LDLRFCTIRDNIGKYQVIINIVRIIQTVTTGNQSWIDRRGGGCIGKRTG